MIGGSLAESVAVGSLICRIEVEETAVNGSFNMLFLGHSISLGYRNHTNIIMRYTYLAIYELYIYLTNL